MHWTIAYAIVTGAGLIMVIVAMIGLFRAMSGLAS